VLVTQASAGFIPASAEWVLGAMIDLGRRISISTEDFHAGKSRHRSWDDRCKARHSV